MQHEAQECANTRRIATTNVRVVAAMVDARRACRTRRERATATLRRVARPPAA
jgi:hypothetical protein